MSSTQTRPATGNSISSATAGLLSTAKNRLVRGPNNDTLYSIAILDLGAEPMVFHVPDMGNRYYAFQFVDLETNNIGYIGTRATGNQEGWYAVTGPNWQGHSRQKSSRRSPAPAALSWFSAAPQ